MNSYDSLKQYLSEGRSKVDRPLPGRSTRLHLRDNESLAIRYHNTDVVTWHPDGSCVLQSGGYQTVTTKARFNEYMPAGWTVYQEAGIWYLQSHTPDYWKGPTYLYQDGITIHGDGTVTGAGTKEQAERKADLAKQINTYCSAFMDALFSGEVPAPSGGDCWHCAMRIGKGETQTGTLHRDGTLTNQASMGPAASGKTWGEHQNEANPYWKQYRDWQAMNALDLLRGGDGIPEPENHLISHLDEPYYVPSLLLRAGEVMGISIAAKQCLTELWTTGTVQSEWFGGIARDQLKSALRRYLRLQLGIGS